LILETLSRGLRITIFALWYYLSITLLRQFPKIKRGLGPANNMIRLEDLQPTAAIRGVLPDQVVTVVSVQWFGSEALELTYKDATGRVANELLHRHDEPRLEVVEHGRPWSFERSRVITTVLTSRRSLQR
jgi:hypothetical protein